MFKINRKLLAAELGLLVQIAGQKNVIPALETIRFEVRGDAEAASLLASSADMALFTEVPASGDDWRGCIPAHQLSDLIRLASNVEEVTFTPQGSLIQIAWGRSRHRLPTREFKEFSDIDIPPCEGEPVTVKGDEFTGNLERILPCADRRGNSRYAMQGIKFEAKHGTLKMIGMDGARMGVASMATTGTLDIFLPLKTADLLAKVKTETITIWEKGGRAIFSFDHRALMSQLLAAGFPNWEMIMPKHLPLSTSFQTQEMIGALKRADVTRDETFKEGVGKIQMGVVLVFGKEEIIIDTRHSDVYGRSEESVNVSSNLNGELIYMGMNPDYLADFLRLAGPTTECFLKDGNSVLKMTDGSSFEYLVVPQRV